MAGKLIELKQDLERKDLGVGIGEEERFAFKFGACGNRVAKE